MREESALAKTKTILTPLKPNVWAKFEIPVDTPLTVTSLIWSSPAVSTISDPRKILETKKDIDR